MPDFLPLSENEKKEGTVDLSVQTVRQMYKEFSVQNDKAVSFMTEKKVPCCIACMKKDFDFKTSEIGKDRFMKVLNFMDYAEPVLQFSFLRCEQKMVYGPGSKRKDVKVVERTWQCRNNHTNTILYTEEEEQFFKQKK